jgi:hypothetical protein
VTGSHHAVVVGMSAVLAHMMIILSRRRTHRVRGQRPPHVRRGERVVCVVRHAVVAGAQVPVCSAAAELWGGGALVGTQGGKLDGGVVGGGAVGGALAEGEAEVLGLPGREGGADAAALGDADAAADVVGAGEGGAWGDGLGGGGVAEDVDVTAGLVAYPQRVGSHVGVVCVCDACDACESWRWMLDLV